MVTLQETLSQLSPQRRQQIDARTKRGITEYETLDQFRNALVHAHDVIADRPSACPEHGPVPQEANEKILGLLHQCVEAMGGRFSVIVELPGRPPLALTDFEVADDEFHERGALYHKLTTFKEDWLEQATLPE